MPFFKNPVKCLALASCLTGVGLSFYAILSLSGANSSNEVYNWNVLLASLGTLGGGLGLTAIGGLSYDNSGYAEPGSLVFRIANFFVSAISGALSIAVVLVSLPLFPNGTFLPDCCPGEPVGVYYRPRVNLGPDIIGYFWFLAPGVVVLLVGAALYSSLWRIHRSRNVILTFSVGYGLIIAGVFLVLYPWTMGVTLHLMKVLPAYCSNPAFGHKVAPPPECINSVVLTHGPFWIAIFGGLVIFFGSILGQRAVRSHTITKLANVAIAARTFA